MVEEGCEAVRTKICCAIALVARHDNRVCKHNAIAVEATLQVAEHELATYTQAVHGAWCHRCHRWQLKTQLAEHSFSTVTDPLLLLLHSIQSATARAAG